MTDIMDSQAVKAAAAASAANAAQPSAHQPLRTAVVKAAELARAAEERARDKQHAKGKKTARERLDLLFDTGTFEEIGRFQGGNIAGGNAGAAVITGFGQVYGRKVAVYAQDFSVKGGTLGTAEGEKICRLMDMAIDLKVPIVAIVDSGGARIQEGVAALTQYGRIFRKTCEASGFVPQLSLILGPCAGGAVYCPALTDLMIMTRENSNMFVTGPDVVKASTGETISMADLGGGEVHNRVSGVAHYLGEDESDAIDYARTVLAYLPSNSESKPPVYAYAVTRAERETAKRLATIVPTNERQPYDMLEVIRCIVDYGEFVQVQELFGASALVGFACIDGKPVGIVANQPNVLAGILDVELVRESRPIRTPVRRVQPARGHPRGCARLQARLRPGTRRHHPPRRQGDLRLRQRTGTDGDRGVAQGVRRRVHRDADQGHRRGPELRVALLPDRGARRGRRGEHHPPPRPGQGQGLRTGRRCAAGQVHQGVRDQHRQREPVTGNRADRRQDRSRTDP